MRGVRSHHRGVGYDHTDARTPTDRRPGPNPGNTERRRAPNPNGPGQRRGGGGGGEESSEGEGRVVEGAAGWAGGGGGASGATTRGGERKDKALRGGDGAFTELAALAGAAPPPPRLPCGSRWLGSWCSACRLRRPRPSVRDPVLCVSSSLPVVVCDSRMYFGMFVSSAAQVEKASFVL